MEKFYVLSKLGCYDDVCKSKEDAVKIAKKRIKDDDDLGYVVFEAVCSVKVKPTPIIVEDIK